MVQEWQHSKGGIDRGRIGHRRGSDKGSMWHQEGGNQQRGAPERAGVWQLVGGTWGTEDGGMAKREHGVPGRGEQPRERTGCQEGEAVGWSTG